MSDQTSAVRQTRRARAARVVAIAVASLSSILTAYWLSRIARHVPDAYAGETGGGLFLNLCLLASSSGQLVAGKRARILLIAASLVFLLIAMYFAFGYQRGADIHLPRG